MAVGVVVPSLGKPSLARAAAAFQRRLAAISIALFSLLLALVTYAIATSHLRT